MSVIRRLRAFAAAIVPLLLVFLVFGRQIISGVMEGAVKA